MKTLKNSLSLLLLFTLLFACKPGQKTASTGGDDKTIEVVFLQINDVYEISPLGTESLGGLARVATLRKELHAKNPNTICVMAGDFISPSVIGTLKYEGKRIRGKQMVEVLNALGLEYTAFGNHEFDYDLADLQARLDESNFTWIGSNLLQVEGDTKRPFAKNRDGRRESCPENVVFTVTDGDGSSCRIGLFSATIPSNPKSYVAYEDHVASVKRNLEAMKGKADVVLGLTHLDAETDKDLLKMFPQVPLIMGGHEHDNQIHRVGRSVVAKADANAKTVYIHTLKINTKTMGWTLKSELKKVDASIAEEPNTAAVVAKWEKIKTESLSSLGFDASKKVVDLKAPLDCREAAVRNKQVQVGDWITSAMLAASKTKPDCAILNSGSIRVDDILTGTLTELDIVRMLPFGGQVWEVEMRGSLLKKTLDAGQNNKGNGGFLQLGNIKNDAGVWKINGQALSESKIYRVALGDFLLTGNEMNMGFLKADLTADGKATTNTDILSISKPNPTDKSDLRSDIRQVLIAYLRK